MSEQFRTKTQALETIKELVGKHNVSNYKIQFVAKGNKRTTVASCNTFYKIFSFVEHYALYLNDKHFVQVVLHEIAHALTPGHKHDPHFKHVCEKIGGNPYACSDYSYAEKSAPKHLQKKVNYIYKCETCGHEMKTTRRVKREYSCGVCSPKFDRNYLLKLVE